MFDFDRILAVDYDFILETTHLLQLKEPEGCVAMMREFLGQRGLLNGIVPGR